MFIYVMYIVVKLYSFIIVMRIEQIFELEMRIINAIYYYYHSLSICLYAFPSSYLSPFTFIFTWWTNEASIITCS